MNYEWTESDDNTGETAGKKKEKNNVKLRRT